MFSRNRALITVCLKYKAAKRTMPEPRPHQYLFAHTAEGSQGAKVRLRYEHGNVLPNRFSNWIAGGNLESRRVLRILRLRRPESIVIGEKKRLLKHHATDDLLGRYGFWT